MNGIQSTRTDHHVLVINLKNFTFDIKFILSYFISYSLSCERIFFSVGLGVESVSISNPF